MQVADVATVYQALVHGSEVDVRVGVSPPESAFEGVHGAAALRDSGFFCADALPPTLLHTGGRSNANWLYGGSRASPVVDAAYKPGKFDLKGKLRQHRRLIGAAFLRASDTLAVPTLLYQLDLDGNVTIIAHVFDAPLAELESQLVDPEYPLTPFEKVVHGGEILAEKMRELRVLTGKAMRDGGLAALPGFLVTGDYHLERPGLVAMLRLRAPETDLELEILERVCMTAMQHLPEAEPSPVVAEDSRLQAHQFLAVFDRCSDEFDFLNACSDGEMNDSHKQFLDYKTAHWAEATKLARRQVVVPLAAALLNHGQTAVAVEMEVIARAEIAASKFELGEASDMARAADNARMRRPWHGVPHMTELLGMCPGASRLRHMSPSSYHHDVLGMIASQVFEGAVEADLSIRDIDAWAGEPGAGGRANQTNALVQMARRVDEPNAMLVFELCAGQSIASTKLIGSAIHSEHIDNDEAARLLSFPWVVPVATNDSVGAPHGLLAVEQVRVARDKLRVTDAHRLRFGAKAKPAASPEDMAAFKREVSDKLVSFGRDLRALTDALATRPVDTTATPPTAVVAPPARAVSCTGKALAQTVDVLSRMLRKRGVAALSAD